MYEKLKKSVSLMITAAMLTGAMPLAFAENEGADWDVSAAKRAEEQLQTTPEAAVEETAAKEGENEVKPSAEAETVEVEAAKDVTESASDEETAKKIAAELKLEAETVSADFELPTEKDGAAIAWTSEDSDTVAVDGAAAVVTRPAYNAKNKQVMLTASVKYGEATAEKKIAVTVVKNEGPVNDAENVAYAFEKLEELGFDTDKAKAVSTDMNLPTALGNATIEWKSTDTDWIADNGAVVQTPDSGEGNHVVSLMATIKSGDVIAEYSYDAAVKPAPKAKAYPGAEGYGTQTRGGAGGYVYHVTTLAADGPGSLKYGLENMTGRRTIVFDVGGTIDLTPVGRALNMRNEAGSQVTIAGQTAPGDGIQLKGYGIALSAVEDVIIRNISIRIGNVRRFGDTYQSDPLAVSGASKRVVLDHISMCWGVDMGFRIDGEEVTMSNCMISKGLYWNTPHEKGQHNYAGMFRSKYGSFYNNYIADMGQRAPRIIDNEYIDVRNNVVFNSKYTFDICNYEWMGANTKFNIINNMVLKGSTAPGGSSGNAASGGSYKYFQGRSYSGGVISYTVNNLDEILNARPSVDKYRDGGLWQHDTDYADKKKVLGEELGVINAGGYSLMESEWRDMVFPDDISMSDYDATYVAQQGNTLVNYPFPAPDMTTRDPDDAAKYVIENAGAKYPVRGILDYRYLTEARTRLKISSDYSKASKSQGIRLIDADLAELQDPTTAYGLPVHTHSVYEDKYGSTVYDVDGYTVTDPENYTLVEQYKFVEEENDLRSIYATDKNTGRKYRVETFEFEDEDTVHSKFEVYDVNGNILKKPNPYVDDAENDKGRKDEGTLYFGDNGEIKLACADWGDGPGNYKHEDINGDTNISYPNFDMEWTDEDWPMLPTVSRGSYEDMEENPDQYVNRKFDSNNDGIPDYFVQLMGWDKREDFDRNEDISYLDFEGRGYTNLEYYMNDYLCGDVEKPEAVANDPVEVENVRDGSKRYNTHRSHQILFNTARRAKAQLTYWKESEGEGSATQVNLNKVYDVTDDKYVTANDFNTYHDVVLPADPSASLDAATKYQYRIKTYSDTGVEYTSDVYEFTTEAVSEEKPGTPRVLKYITTDGKITLQFEPYAPNKSYKQDSANGRLLTTISSNQYDNMVDHYVIRYSENEDLSNAKEITVSGNAASYSITGLENGKDYYIELKAVNGKGTESDGAVFNKKVAAELPDKDKDGNPIYGVDKIKVLNKKEVDEYFYDTEFSKIAVAPTRYAVNEDYTKTLAEAEIGKGETTKFITYYGDVKDWYIYTLGGIPIPSERDGELMLMLRDEAHEHGFTYAKKFDTALTGKSTVECMLMIDDEQLDPMNQNPEFRFYLQEASGMEDTDSDTDSSSGAFGNIASLSFAKNEINYNGKSYARYEDGVWYKIKLLLDSDKKTCSLYINDSLIASDLDYVNASSSSPTALQRWQLSSRLAGTEDVYVKYMYAYSGWEDPETGKIPGQGDSDVEEGSSGSKPTKPSKPSAGGGGGGGGAFTTVDTIIRDGDFTESPKVEKGEATPAPTTAPQSYVNVSFNDMGGFEWAHEAVQSLYEKGIVKGVGSSLFAPEREVTRAEFVTMLMRGFGLVGTEASCNYGDVKDGDWYYHAIASASAMGIVNGYPDGTFGVDEHITRQDMTVMCVRLAECVALELKAVKEYDSFSDQGAIADYAKASVETLNKAGIVNGTGEGAFSPKGVANRAQAAKIIYELLKVQ